MPILVTGARGNVGSAVVRGLLDAGGHVRAASRSLTRSDVPDGVEVASIDLTKPESLRAALTNVTQVFLYTESGDADRLVEVLVDGGVEQVVLLSSASVLFPDADTNPIAQQHLALERRVQASRVRWTAVRPAYFAANALRWTSIKTDRVLRTAFPDGETPMVHERDIADLAVAALTSTAYDGRALTALGDGRSRVADQVTAIGAVIGAEVRIERLTVEQYREELSSHIPTTMVDRLIRAEGSAPLPDPSVATDDVELVLHRAPLPFAQWAADHVNYFR